MKLKLIFTFLYLLFYTTTSLSMQQQNNQQLTPAQITALLAMHYSKGPSGYRSLSDLKEQIHPSIANSALPYVPHENYGLFF